MHIVIAFSESLDAEGADFGIAAVPDQTLTYEGDNVMVPLDYNKIFAKCAFLGATGLRAHLEAPSLRTYNRAPITPVILGNVPTGDDPIDYHPEGLIPLVTSEQLQAYNQASAEDANLKTVAVFLTSGDITPVKGSIRSIEFTVTSAITTTIWNTATISLIEELPAGTYQLVGARFECAVATIARFILNSVHERPALVCSADEDHRFQDYFRYGRIGSWGTFAHTNLPKIEILGASTTGSATYRGVLDVIKQ